MAQGSNVLTLLKAELSKQLGASGFEVFNKLNVSDWGAFFRIGEREWHEPNAVILREGQPGEAVYFIAEGDVRIVQQNGDKEIELAKLSSGSIFGEMTYLDGDEVSATVIADGPVEVVRVANYDLDRLMTEDSQFASHFYHSLAVNLSRRLRATNKIVTIGD